MKSLERFLEWGGVRRELVCLALSGLALLASLLDWLPGLPVDAAWAAILLCGIPIVLEAVVGLVTAFDIKADVLVSIALIASVLKMRLKDSLPPIIAGVLVAGFVMTLLSYGVLGSLFGWGG